MVDLVASAEPLPIKCTCCLLSHSHLHDDGRAEVMQKTRDTVQTPYEGLESMLRTSATPYPRTLARGASTTVPQPRSPMESQKGFSDDTFDLIYPALLLLAVCAVFVLIAGFSGNEDYTRTHTGTYSTTRPSQHNITRIEKAHQRKVCV
jgi:hypothetical protein